jgi:hypothetical protein
MNGYKNNAVDLAPQAGLEPATHGLIPSTRDCSNQVHSILVSLSIPDYPLLQSTF